MSSGGGGGGDKRTSAPVRGGEAEIRRVFAKREPVPSTHASGGPVALRVAQMLGEAAKAPGGALANPQLASVQKISDVAELHIYLSQLEATGINPDWLALNRTLISFISGIASAREDSKFHASMTPKADEIVKDWPYYTANAIHLGVLDEKGEKLEQVILQYVPGVIGEAILRGLRALHVLKPDFGRHRLVEFIKTSVNNPRNTLAGAFRTLVELEIQRLTIRNGYAAWKRLQFTIAKEDALLEKLKTSCGQLSLTANDCPSTLSR